MNQQQLARTMRTILHNTLSTLLILLLMSMTNFASTWAAITPTTPTLTDGVYQITSAAELLGFADIVNGTNGQTRNLTACAVLTSNIDLGGEANGSWPSMGSSSAKYQGTFDGGGHTISGFYQSFTGSASNHIVGVGLFGYTSGANIKNFKLEGECLYNSMTSNSFFISTVVANGTGTTIEDVTSTVNMTFDSGNVGTRIIGGIAGRNDGSINRCRYNGTIDLGATVVQKVAGICASSFGVQITNCLFDGTIKSESSNTNTTQVIIGGILGHDESRTTVIAYCLSNGTITLTKAGITTTNVGIVWGQVAGTAVKTQTVYYSTANCTKGGSVLDQCGGSNASGTNATNGCLKLDANPDWTAIRNSLKAENWHIEPGRVPAYPIPGAAQNCTHDYSESGWCKICAMRKPLQQDTDGTYLISCLAQFASFRDLVNKSAGAELNAKFTHDMDFNLYIGYLGEPIGYNTANPYHGTFDGQGHSIIGVRVEGHHDYIGQFGYIRNATIKDLNISGTVDLYTDCQYIGSIAGYAKDECHLEDIASTISINCDKHDEGESANHQVRVIGGLVGHIEGQSTNINRCQFGGTITSQIAYDRIGGIVGETANGTLTNTLFDGTITIASPAQEIIVGGLVGQLSGSTNRIANCLSHGAINQTSTRSGALVGYADNKPFTLDRVLYTACGSVATPYGTALTGKVTTTNNYPWDITTGTKLYDGEAHALLGETNWTQTQFTEGHYPVPGAVEGATHQHSYNANGFCKANDGDYQSASMDIDGYYAIQNAGQLWWIAQQLNCGNLSKTAHIKLTQDIDMEGEARGSFPGICTLGTKVEDGKTVDDWETAFQGIFDGKGFTISNYYRTMSSGLRQGLINTAYNATIRNFSINGNFVLTTGGSESALVGVVVGSARGTTTIEDVHSSVAITSTNSRGLGGIIGALEDTQNTARVSMNRCRYSGIITLTGNKNQSIGGLCGELRSGIIRNSLFDGTIQAATGVSYLNVGGIVGKVSTNSNSEMHRLLCHGTISLADYAAETHQSGIVVGAAEKTLYMEKCYHTTSRGVSGLPVVGPHSEEKEVDTENFDGKQTITVDLVLGDSEEITNLTQLYSAAFRTTLGEPNWAEVTSGYTYPLKDVGHQHRYANGFCTSGDGEYEKPNSMGSVYQIDNGGKLYWFAERFNDGEIDQDATVEIMCDIDMEGNKYSYPGIGSQKRPFTGTFNGHGYTISGFDRTIVNSEYNGLINYANNATIQKFKLNGAMHFNLSTIKSFHGTVVGCALGTQTLIEDVASSVNVKMKNYMVRVFGGIAGRCSGTINRCRYAGTIAGEGSGRQIGGICANAKESLLIDNCLFDGTITSTCATADTMRIAGILASTELRSAVDVTIKNSLMHGCLHLQHTFSGEKKSTENGIIAGYWDTGKVTKIDNVFYLGKCDAMCLQKWPLGSWRETPKPCEITSIQSSESTTYWDAQAQSANWEAIKDQLNRIDTQPDHLSWDFIVVGNKNVGVTPVAITCDHKCNRFGWCPVCGGREPIQISTDGEYLIYKLSDLATFRDIVNAGNTSTNQVLNARMMNDLDFDGFTGELGEPIGNSVYNRYLYNFNGQGYAIRNIRVTTDQQFVGMFGFAGDKDHDCYIHDFTITGYIDSPYRSAEHDDQPLYAGVVGKMYRGTIRNVHSQMEIRNQNETQIVIGGILGSAESEDASNAVTVTQCSYTGAATINGYGRIGGIVGQSAANTLVDHCTFAGSLDHTYTGNVQMTQFSGIVGYNESSAFRGVQNCVIAGMMKTAPTTTFQEYGVEGNHKNILCGEDRIITLGPSDDYKTRYTGNYALNVYSGLIPTNSIVYPTYITYDQCTNGELCVIMDAQDDCEWGQILGFGYSVLDTDGKGSPANRAPMPGYQTPDGTVYHVALDASNNYKADYYYFDDKGDFTPFPADATTLSVKRIEHTRDKKYINGYCSVCLPFALTADMKPTDDTKFYTFASADEQMVRFTEVKEFPIAAGTPLVMYVGDPNTPGTTDWQPSKFIPSNGTEYTPVATSVANPSGYGIYGSFCTTLLGEGYWKINSQGSALVYTISTSHCYPYRVYLKLEYVYGDSGAPERYAVTFEDADDIAPITADAHPANAPCYNLQGQPVSDTTRPGLYIRGGRAVLVK